jgi:hypothetical protein
LFDLWVSIIVLATTILTERVIGTIKKDYAVSAEVYGVPALTASSLIDAASSYHPIEEDLLI